MLPQGNNVSYLVGNQNCALDKRGLIPFDELVCEFLNTLSSALLKNPETKQFSDVVSFAFWCRKANLAKLKNEFKEKQVRLGLGLVFHIAPSNVPVNFAFSFAISILAGNANIVRVPSKYFVQIDIICSAIKELFKLIYFKKISDMTVFIRYDKDDEITGLLSLQCDARIIWGGDQTVLQIRKLPMLVKCREVIFSDRYSFSVISAKQIISMSPDLLNKLAINFYNDTYFMDQDACSSPRLIVWLGNSHDVKVAKERFWISLHEVVLQKYELAPINAMDKFTQLCRDAIDLYNLSDVIRYGNYIYCIGLNDLPNTVDDLRGRFGYFYEYETEELSSVAHIVNTKYQTLTYFGVERHVFDNFVKSNRITGIDRIVPIGLALDISVIWDGYDLVRTLSRVIDIR